MANEPTWIHGADPPGGITHRYARCQVCRSQWQIHGPDNEDAEACAFCGAPALAITIISEALQYGGAEIIR